MCSGQNTDYPSQNCCEDFLQATNIHYSFKMSSMAKNKFEKKIQEKLKIKDSNCTEPALSESGNESIATNNCV